MPSGLGKYESSNHQSKEKLNMSFIVRLFLSTFITILLSAGCIHAQCPNNTSNLFRFTPGTDTLFTDTDCNVPLDFGNPSVESLSGLAINTSASKIDEALTGYTQGQVVTAGLSIDVYFIAVEAAPTSRRDTFCYNIVVLDNSAPTFESLPESQLNVCIGDIPDPFPLNALDNCDGIISVFPVDDTIPVTGLCSGGTIRRTWTALDSYGFSTVFVQVITVEADNETPRSSFDPQDVTEYCGIDDFNNWISVQQNNILRNATDNCGIANIYNDAPLFLDTCGNYLIQFTLEDFCGNTLTFDATYTLQDTTPPSFVNLPSNLTILCGTPLPQPANVQVIDECGSATITFKEVVMPSTTPRCGNLKYLRNWTATDACGNSRIGTQVIEVVDTVAPNFTTPADIMVNCGADYNNLSITGEVTNLTDNCDSVPSIFFNDQIFAGGGIARIERTWIAKDACNNTTSKKQLITIEDSEKPTFIRPTDLTVDCGKVAELDITGRPTQVRDNCDNELTVTYRDIFSAGSCAAGGAIQRVWRVSDDAGNATEQTQLIRINDQTIPQFTKNAQNTSVACSDTLSATQAFSDWLQARGGARAIDNCSDTTKLIWVAYTTGTTNTPTLTDVICPSPNSSYRSSTVDFIVRDECGNLNKTTATFSIIDNTAPTFAYCPKDTTIQAAEGACAANFTLIPPIVVERCGTKNGSYRLSITESIASNSPNNRDVPVNSVRLSFLVLPSSNFASDSVSLTIQLTNVDAEQSPEYFNIRAEDGTYLGRTTNASAQCGSSTTVITSITGNQINEWAGSNGLVTFYLEPNIPEGQPGRFAINDICTGSKVDATLFYETLSPENMAYQYQINGGTRISFLPETPVFADLNAAENRITYYATDCAGNTSSCSYMVRIIDNVPPSIDCPNDTLLRFSGNNCAANFQLPLPKTVKDNCATGVRTEISLPADTTTALLTFTFDPDLNDYLADNKTFVFKNLVANSLTDATLIISFKGDLDNENGFFTILGDDNIPLATTALGQPDVTFGDCARFSRTTIAIPANLFNLWAEDGEIKITAVSNSAIPIPPGGPGDGINPCDPSVVNQDGDKDGVSMLFATLSYDNTQYQYFAKGATTLPLTTIQNGDPLPTFEFAAGTTEIFYVVEDANRNVDTCFFKVVVEDTEKPQVLCAGTTISINPSGTMTDTLKVQDVNLSSSDNCTIDTMFVFPNIFDCTFAGRDTVNVTLTAIDQSGNVATCKAPIRIITQKPTPSYFIPPCGGDTLFLFTNPPAATGNNIYTYEWTGPKGFASNLQNPMITNINGENAGSYQVRITGVTGCKALGIVEVAINDLPIVPELTVSNKVCSNTDLVLMTNVVPQGGTVAYKWYAGMPTNSTLIGTTVTPSLTLSAPLLTGTFNYYVQVEVNGCTSSPSAVKTIKVVELPTAVVDNPNPAPICAGGTIRLGTFVVGDDLTYQWRGPNGYLSNAQIPPAIENVTVNNDGVYQLTITRDGCVSKPANVSVTVRSKPQKPILTASNAACEGGDITLRMNVTNATVYHWQSPDGNRQITQTNTLTLSGVTAQNAGFWRGYITQGGCESDLSEAINIVVNNTPNLSLSANPIPICVGKDLQLNASPALDGAVYEWKGPDGFLAVGQNPTIANIQPGKAGTYTCVITTAQGCKNTKQVEVPVQESVRITGVSNSSSNQCINGAVDVQLAVTVFPADNGSYKYLWEGPNFRSTTNIATIPNATAANSGSYTIVVTTADGCSSEKKTTTVALKNAPISPTTPSLSETTAPPFCEGDQITLVTNTYSGGSVEYIWLTPTGDRTTSIPTLTINAADVNDDGEYAVFVKIDGCDSRQSGTTRVRVSSVPEIMVNGTSPLCEGDRLELEADFIEGAQYRWEGPSGFSASGTNPVIPHADPSLHNGTFRVRAILNGCSSAEAAFDVTVNEIPNLPIALNNSPICVDAPNTVLRLTVPEYASTLGANYTWYNQDLVPISTPISNLVLSLTNFNGYREGEYKFYVEAKLKGCSSGLSAPTIAKFNAQPANQAFAGQDITVCETASLNLNAAPPSVGTGLWAQISGDTTGIVIANPNDPKTTIFGLDGDGIYAFQWTLSNGACKNYSNDVVSVVLNPSEKADAGAIIDTCSVGAVQLRAKAPVIGQGKWTQPSVQSLLGVIIENVNTPNSTVRGLQPGNLYSFTWTITGGACDEVSDEAIVVISNGFSYAGADFSECGDGCTTLNATEPPTGVGQWKSLTPNIEFNEPNEPNTLICGLVEGKNLLVWTVDNEACGNRSKDTLIVNYQPSAIANADTITLAFASVATFDVTENDNLANTAFNINVSEEPSKGSVEDLGNGVFRYQANPSFSGIDAFSYEICPLGCECTVVPVLVVIGAETACRIPNVFTPNGDGVNDAFIIPCLTNTDQFPNNEVTIFNQWGDEVFRGLGYNNSWQGTYNGEDLPTGTYFYVINFGDGTPPSNGYIIIQR